MGDSFRAIADEEKERRHRKYKELLDRRAAGKDFLHKWIAAAEDNQGHKPEMDAIKEYVTHLESHAAQLEREARIMAAGINALFGAQHTAKKYSQ